LEEIKKRKFFHLSLISIIIILQLLVIVFWFLQTKNDDKIRDLTEKMELYKDGMNSSNTAYGALYNSQKITKAIYSITIKKLFKTIMPMLKN